MVGFKKNCNKVEHKVIKNPKITQKVFFDITEDNKPLGKIVFGLYGDDVPKTVENFARLSAGDAKSKITGKPIHYKGSIFHRIIPQFMAQGGDIQFGDGRGGESIYGKKFDDENFLINHDKPYMLSMANSGKNTNGSQFFITFIPTPWLDGKHVTFGEVIQGKEIVDKMEKLGS